MARLTGRRPGQRGRERGEEYAEETTTWKEPAAGKPETGDSAIAEMARGFVQAQSKMTAAEPAMLALLEKISRQLEELQPANNKSGEQTPSSNHANNQSGGQSQSGGQAAGNQQPGQAAGQPSASPGAATPGADDLAAIFSSLLQAKDANNPGGQGSQNSNAQPAQTKKSPEPTTSTAAQLLAQAQYELANELENSLEKLKKVIDESEKLADKISNLIGQEDGENPS